MKFHWQPEDVQLRSCADPQNDLQRCTAGSAPSRKGVLHFGVWALNLPRCNVPPHRTVLAAATRPVQGFDQYPLDAQSNANPLTLGRGLAL